MVTVRNYKYTDVGNLMVCSNTFVYNIMQSKGSVLGNPFYNRKDLSRAQKIEHFKVWFSEQLRTNIRVQEVIHMLTMMHTQNISIELICACSPQPCHGDVIKSYIEVSVGGIL
jgi:hypothetical protein